MAHRNLQKKISRHEDVKILFYSFEVIGLRETGLDEKSEHPITAFYEDAGEVVAVDIEHKTEGSEMRDLRDREKYLVNPVYPV